MPEELAEIRSMLVANNAAQTGMAHDISWIRDSIATSNARASDHDKRLTSLERWRTWIAGIVVAIGALLGYGGTHALKP